MCLLPELWSLKCQKWLILWAFCWMQQNISSSLSKLFKCICRVIRKYYGLCTSQLPLAKFQCLKIQDFGIPLFTQKFFCCLPTISHEQFSPKPINHTIFCNNSKLSSLCTFNIFPKLWQTFCCYQQKIQNNSWNIITRQMTPFFSYIPSALSIGMFHFEACKIQFHGFTPLH